jgi:cell division protein FtsN
VKRAARPRAAATRGGGGMLVGILIGLVLGILLALGVAWYINQAQLPFQSKGAKPLPEVARPAAEPEAGKPAPTPLPGKPGDKPIERPRFDFYKILPGGEDAAPPPVAAQPAPHAPEEMLYLQAGSFTKPEDADNLKAKLALLGIEASVVEASFPDKGTFHRVRVGPYGKPEEMARTRALLAENGIQAKVVKARDGAPN